ncbi:MAG: hypothetical protein GY733_08325 [bacterium]|nr:hypothetical protein [bacterium]
MSSALTGCANFGAGGRDLRPLRIADVMEEGDAARRASLRLVVEGLDQDVAGRGSRAQARYQRALQVDATNPYAYLAIARHHVEAHDSARALQFLDRAQALLRMQGALTEEVQVHFDGLRGGALYDSGDTDEAVDLLDRARERAPAIWGDGALQPEELR